MDLIGIYMTAYNAEKTIARTLDSILAQTYQNFLVYICDNGSTDRTLEIIKDYSRRYDQIFYTHWKTNFSGSFIMSLYNFYEKKNSEYRILSRFDSTGATIPVLSPWEDWSCIIDSDDILQPTYLEDMLHFAQNNNLEMVMCGWNFVRPNRIDHRVANKDEIIEKNEFAARLPDYDKFMGPVWNKLFLTDSLTRNTSYYENKFSRLFKDNVYFYGADTAFNYFYLGNGLDRFGILAKPLYHYHIWEDSASRKNFHPMRIIADRRMAEVRFDFLQEIGAEITEENRSFIMDIYLKSVDATLELLRCDSRYSLEQRMRYLFEIFNYKLMKEAYSSSGIERYL